MKFWLRNNNWLFKIGDPVVFLCDVLEVGNEIVRRRPADHDRCVGAVLPINRVVAVRQPDLAHQYAILEFVVILVS